jgi:predicted SAM-dependent methyltransferase
MFPVRSEINLTTCSPRRVVSLSAPSIKRLVCICTGRAARVALLIEQPACVWISLELPAEMADRPLTDPQPAEPPTARMNIPAIESWQSAGVRRALVLLRREASIAEIHGRGVARARAFADASDLRLNLGCGPNYKPGWVNIDLINRRADLALDLREEWPFAPGVVAILYAEHFFEHLDHPGDTAHFLKEAMRVLRPGGLLSIGVPDTAWVLRAYHDESDDYWSLVRENWHPPTCLTRIDHINYHFRQDGEHRYAWDAETLVSVIASAGFYNVRQRQYDVTVDSPERKLGTVYVDAQKPTD